MIIKRALRWINEALFYFLRHDQVHHVAFKMKPEFVVAGL